MRNLLFSVFAIGVAAVAAMTATTAMLNAPQRTAAADVITQNIEPDESKSPPASQPATREGAPPATPGGTADTAAKPASGAPASAGNAADKKDTADDEGDKDPYEGIAPEELPPDLQYSADSSVSFPTNI
ncbi:MAG TPA: hypothetical protein VFS13_05135 [Steroidobacteraceae bacterium]|nr:hypothetical protein [Steroidobacteraceae bacterium]